MNALENPVARVRSAVARVKAVADNPARIHEILWDRNRIIDQHIPNLSARVNALTAKLEACGITLIQDLGGG